MKKRNRGSRAAAVLLIGAALLTQSGCFGIDQENKNTLELKENGTLTQVIVDDTEGDVTGEELEAFINESIAQVPDGESVSLNSCRVSGGKVNITLTYSSAAAYADFNNVTCFDGTVKEAYDAGYDFNRTFRVENGSEIPYFMLISETSDCRVLVLEEPLTVTLPGDAYIVSDGATFQTGGTVQVDANPDTTVPEEFQTTTITPAFLIYKTEG